MVKLFQERFRDLPIFKEIERIHAGFENCDFPREEFITRILLAAENGLNWDTLCMNCGVLMDTNYTQYAEIERLKEDLAYAENEARDLQRELDHWEHMNEENRI